MEIVPDRFGGFKNISQVSDETLSLSEYICTGRFPIDPDVMQPTTRGQARVYFEYYTTVQVPCLQSLGYEIPDQPTLEEFLALHAAGKWWMPENDPTLNEHPEELNAALATCPPFPPWAALSGQG